MDGFVARVDAPAVPLAESALAILVLNCTRPIANIRYHV